MPEQTLGGIPLGLGMVMKINFLNFHVLIYHESNSLSEAVCSFFKLFCLELDLSHQCEDARRPEHGLEKSHALSVVA